MRKNNYQHKEFDCRFTESPGQQLLYSKVYQRNVKPDFKTLTMSFCEFASSLDTATMSEIKRLDKFADAVPKEKESRLRRNSSNAS